MRGDREKTRFGRYSDTLLGVFTLRNVHVSWAAMLVIGACDYYGRTDVEVLQIVPDREHRTIDVPDLSRPYSVESEPVWRWLTETWSYDIPERSVGVTNLRALQGDPVTEVVRWESDTWELFAGPGTAVTSSDVRRVPLGTLLAADRTLEPATTLGIGEGIWREPGDWTWQEW